MKIINKTTFSVCKNKVTIKQFEDKSFDFVITDSSKDSYHFKNEKDKLYLSYKSYFEKIESL
jgi:hypothetical protein